MIMPKFTQESPAMNHMINAMHKSGSEQDTLNNLSAYVMLRACILPVSVTNYRLKAKNKKFYYLLYDFNEHTNMERYAFGENSIDYLLS